MTDAIAQPLLLKLQTYALAPGQTLIPKCGLCYGDLDVELTGAVRTLKACSNPKCIEAQAVSDVEAAR